MKILVCGGRDFDNQYKLDEALDKLGSVGLVIHGGARGADTLAGEWAKRRDIPCVVFNPDWEKHGNSAAILRNLEMLKEEPDLVVAFVGERGTAHMKKASLQANVIVFEVL